MWQGFHHVALVTPDLDRTIAFYRDVLGMTIGEIRTGGGVLPQRHCFIRPGEAGVTLGLHFFEHPDAEIPRFPDGLRSRGFIAGALHHIAFALPDAEAAERLRERLTANGVEVTPTNRIGSIENMLFFDVHGLTLEATWPAAAPSEHSRPT